VTDGSSATWVAIGRVGKAHGLDGSFVVEKPSDAAAHFESGSELYLDRAPVRVVASKRAGGRTVIKLDIEAVRGAQLELPRSQLPILGAEEYYVFQLVGLRVETDDARPVGVISDVLPGPANDVLELDNGELLPLVHVCVLRVDISAGLVVIARSFAPDG
jgi:16S rRNA processing protein RimM